MNERRLSALKEDWLAGNAVVAFVGVLLTAQSWNLSDGVYELPFNVTIPVFHDAVYLALGTFLFASSFALALASLVRPLRSRAIRASRPFSALMGLLIWVAFIVSWLGATAELPFDMLLVNGSVLQRIHVLPVPWLQAIEGGVPDHCQLRTGPKER